jgi:hypothetical protein
MPPLELKPGDRVMIYNKAQTREIPEGEATLVERTGRKRWPDSETWLVRFSDDPNAPLVRRQIYTRPAAPSLTGIGEPWPENPHT